MKNPLHDYDTCHKCGGVGIFLNSDHDVSEWYYDYECEDCQATWEVTFELKPVGRNNHES
jgi:hypothetical protein